MTAPEIVYSQEADDFVAFNEFHAANSHALLATSRWSHLLPVLGFAGAALVYWWGESDGVLVGYFAAAAVFWLLLWGRFNRWYRRVVLRRLLREGRNRLDLGEQTLRAGEDGLQSESSRGSSLVRWSAVERIGRTESHVFIYANALSAFTIPRARVKQGDLEALVSEVRSRTGLAG